MPVNSFRHNDDILVMPLIEYTTLWDDIAKVNPSDFLTGIPTTRALEFVVSLQNKVFYAPSDIRTQTEMIFKMAGLLGRTEAMRVSRYVREKTCRGQAPVLVDNYSCLLFYLLALQNYDSTDRVLNDDDYRNIYKAYLYCSHEWLELQQRNIKGLNLTELSILLDLPIVEFKSYKDFKTQLYKATRFFDFCNCNSHFGKFAQWFLEDKGAANASVYLGKLFNMFCHLAKEPIPVYIQIKPEQVDEVGFFDQYVIKPTESQGLWDKRDVNYLRNHFILKTQDSSTGGIKLMVLNVNLLVDKLYQGMMVDILDCIMKRNGCNYKGKTFKDKGDLNSFVIEEFSEHQIFYDALEMAFPSDDIIKIRGKYLHDNGVKGEPDYCLFMGERLFLFEYKDVKVSDVAKTSSDLTLIKNVIFDRICKYETGHNKGVGQLLFNYDRIFNQHLLDRFDVDVSKIKEVFFIVVTTDTAFNTIGVNALIREEYCKIKKRLGFAFPVQMVQPVIIDFETLFSLIIPFRENRFDLGDLICQYNDKTKKGSNRMMPFYAFIRDYIPVPLLKEQDVPILFEGFLDMIKSELAQ